MTKITLANDDLDRGRYARSLYRIIGDYTIDYNYNNATVKAMTNTDNKAFIMAASAPWGFGKTHFMKLFQKVLKRDETAFIEGIDEFDENLAIKPDNIILYDAWENDFWDNALEPLYDKILNSPFNALTKKENEEQTETDKLLKPLKSIVTMTMKGVLSYAMMLPMLAAMPETSKQDIIKSPEKLFDYLDSINKDYDPAKDVFGEYAAYRNAIKELRKNLENATRQQGKLVIIINELQHCVKRVYSDDFNAVGYLEKYFDCASLLPQGNMKELFKQTLSIFEVVADDDPFDVFLKICSKFQLSARETRAVCSSSHYLEKHELEGYPKHAKQLYFFLLVMKYKDPVGVIEAISESAKTQDKRNELMAQYEPVFSPDNNKTKEFVTVFKENAVIGQYAKYRSIDEDGGKTDDPRSLTFTETQGLTEYSSYSYALYKPDHDQYQTIKDYRLLEHFFRKVELYDTAI